MSDLTAIDRRGMLAQLALLLGAAALPVEAMAAPRARVRRFLAPAQFTLLGAAVDTLIPASDTPGAIAAKVPARLDALLLNWASAQSRSNISGALGRIDAAARASKQKGFVALTPAERAEVLRLHDVAALKAVPPPPGAKSANPFAPVISVADNGYYKLKELTIQLYYFSEVASTSELIYEHVPGQFQPSIKLTPQSRPYLGTGPF
jgi:gluconate 2-dehydrogenase gamma chain